MGVQPRRKSRLVLWISIIAVMLAIVATALLANDKKNLREIIRRYKIDWIKLDSAEPPKTVVLAKRGKRLVPTASNIPDRLPPHAFDTLISPPASLVRKWQVSGEQLCGAFATAGLDVGSWHQGDLYSSTYECSSDVSTQGKASADDPSLFLLVRGTPSGEVSSVRMKVIIPDTEGGRSIAQKFNAAVEALFKESRWAELGDALESIENLRNINQTTFGARLSFAHEFNDTHRFNLILDLYPADRQQKTTAAYFDRSKWLPLVQDSLN